ncbi:MAG: hypothetical protein ABIN79_05705 [Marmoricola sp.]
MVDSHFDFVDQVAADRDLILTSAGAHACRLEPRESDLAWHCDLDDGTPTDTDCDPAAFVRWVCPALRAESSATSPSGAVLDVRRTGPQSDLGRLIKGLGRFTGRASRHTADGDGEGRYAYTDPTGILDVALRRLIENWPSAQHGDGGIRPAELLSVKCTREGLIVDSVSWWGSAPALDHQIGLALEIAHRLATRR